MRLSFFRIFVLAGFFIFPIMAPLPNGVRAETVSDGMQPSVAEPLTVTGVLIDRTAENAVVARDQAIAEARKKAFQMLAERNMTPEQREGMALPDDQTLSGLVQDFEIENEQLSATRYVASFTVRFRDQVKNYIAVKYPVQDRGQIPLAQGADVASAASAADVGAAGLLSKPLLVLPYFEDISGRTLLWEDANPWREVWQSFAPVLPQGEGPLFVPLGDIGDVGTGPSNAVWSGDSSVVETLRRNYGAENVVLAVANKSGPSLVIDVYVYAAGRLQRLSSLTPYVGGKDEQAALRQGMEEVLGFLQKPQAPPRGAADVEGISRSLLPRTVPEKGNGEGDIRWESGWSNPVTMEAPAPQAVKNALRGTMSFQSFPQWVEMQKRLAAVMPPVRLDIKALDRAGAQFTLQYDGDVMTLKQALAEQGIVLGLPTVEVGKPIDTSGATQSEIYDFTLAQ